VAATRQLRAAVRARRGVATADRWGLLSVISELKITPKEIISNQIVGIEKNSGKIHRGRKLNLEHFSQLTFPPDLHEF
jgi:hypothetical protein